MIRCKRNRRSFLIEDRSLIVAEYLEVGGEDEGGRRIRLKWLGVSDAAIVEKCDSILGSYRQVKRPISDPYSVFADAGKF